MSDRLRNSRLRRFWRGQRGGRTARAGFDGPQPIAIHAAEAAGTAAVPATVAAPATTSVATLLTRHILRDGEIILLMLKPSLWTIFFSTLPAIGVAIIVMISTCLWAPHHVHVGVELGSMLIAVRAGWAILNWTGRLYLLTDLRIVRIAGVFSPVIHDIPLRKVARTRLTTSFRERCCRLGSIEIIPESDNWPWSVWQTISKPAEVHDTVRRAINRAKQGGGHGGRW